MLWVKPKSFSKPVIPRVNGVIILPFRIQDFTKRTTIGNPFHFAVKKHLRIIFSKSVSGITARLTTKSNFCLKGGELGNETIPVKNSVEMWDLKDYFEEEFFETKKVVYVGIKN